MSAPWQDYMDEIIECCMCGKEKYVMEDVKYLPKVGGTVCYPCIAEMKKGNDPRA